MPEENQNQPESPEGETPVQSERETPEETPPVVEGTEEQPTGTETPAKTDSDQAVVEEAAGKTPEQVEADRAYYQSEAQKAKEQLRRIRDAHKVETPETKPETPAAPSPDRDWLTNLSGLSNEELTERLKDDPVLMMQIQDFREEQRLNRMLDERERRAFVRAQYDAEARATTRHLDGFCEKHKIDSNRVYEIREELVKLGLKGSPAAIGELIQDRLNMELMQQNIGQRSTEAAAKAAQAAKTQPLTTQPDGGGPETPVKEKTVEEQIADRFSPSRGQKAINQLFGD